MAMVKLQDLCISSYSKVVSRKERSRCIANKEQTTDETRWARREVGGLSAWPWVDRSPCEAARVVERSTVVVLSNLK